MIIVATHQVRGWKTGLPGVLRPGRVLVQRGGEAGGAVVQAAGQGRGQLRGVRGHPRLPLLRQPSALGGGETAEIIQILRQEIFKNSICSDKVGVLKHFS